MKRKIALPLLITAFAVSATFASRIPQPIAEELPQKETENPPLLTLTEEVGGQMVTLAVYEMVRRSTGVPSRWEGTKSPSALP